MNAINIVNKFANFVLYYFHYSVLSKSYLLGLATLFISQQAIAYLDSIQKHLRRLVADETLQDSLLYRYFHDILVPGMTINYTKQQ